MLGRVYKMSTYTGVYFVSKPYRYARKVVITIEEVQKIKVSKPYRYARKPPTIGVISFDSGSFKTL